MSAVVPPPPNNLAKFRKQLGLTAYALARRVGVAPQTITRIETGFIRKPRAVTKDAIAAALGLKARDVFPDA